MPNLLTTIEVAKILKITKSNVIKMAKNGSLPAVKVNERDWRIDEDDLSKWLKSRSNQNK